jgi:hypothetical protein
MRPFAASSISLDSTFIMNTEYKTSKEKEEAQKVLKNEMLICRVFL